MRIAKLDTVLIDPSDIELDSGLSQKNPIHHMKCSAAIGMSELYEIVKEL